MQSSIAVLLVSKILNDRIILNGRAVGEWNPRRQCNPQWQSCWRVKRGQLITALRGGGVSQTVRDLSPHCMGGRLTDDAQLLTALRGGGVSQTVHIPDGVYPRRCAPGSLQRELERVEATCMFGVQSHHTPPQPSALLSMPTPEPKHLSLNFLLV